MAEGNKIKIFRSIFSAFYCSGILQHCRQTYCNSYAWSGRKGKQDTMHSIDGIDRPPVLIQSLCRLAVNLHDDLLSLQITVQGGG